jgi:hypothetical protein
MALPNRVIGRFTKEAPMLRKSSLLIAAVLIAPLLWALPNIIITEDTDGEATITFDDLLWETSFTVTSEGGGDRPRRSDL